MVTHRRVSTGAVNKLLREGVSKPFVVRRLARSGGSRYLAVGTIIPKDWENVKITIERISNDYCVLSIEPIR